MSSLASCVSTYTDIIFRVSMLGSPMFGGDLCRDRLNPFTVKELKDFVNSDELNDYLADFFASRNETTLQHTYAKILIENLLIDWLPTLKTITGQIAHLQGFTFTELRVDESGDLIHVTKDLSGPEFSAIHQNIQELWEIHYILVRYNRRIINHIRQFAPSLYDQNLTAFQQYVPTERPEPKRPDIQNVEPLQSGVTPPQLGVKLQWKGDKTDLAELIWALVKSEQIVNTENNKPVIIAELTQRFETLFGIEKLDVDGLVSKRILNTYRHIDGKTFLDTLQKLMQERVARSQKK